MDKAYVNKINTWISAADEVGLDTAPWGPIDMEDIGTGWKEILGHTTPKFSAEISYGLGDQVLAIIEAADHKGLGYYTADIKRYFVGIGEALRPYSPLYSGTSEEQAYKAFHNKAQEMVHVATHEDEPEM